MTPSWKFEFITPTQIVNLVGNCPGGEWFEWIVVMVGSHPGGSCPRTR